MDVRQALRVVEEWEAATGKLKVEFGEELSEVVQIAILTGMLPSDLQDEVFEVANAGDLNYHKVRDAIVGIMNNPARVLEPTPMDVGQVGGPVRESVEDSYDWGWRRRTVHFRCCCSWEGHVRFGHFARECPTPESEDKVKGAKGFKGGVDFRFKGKVESVKGGWVWYGKFGFTDNGLRKGNKGKSGGRSVGCVVRLVTRRQSAAERGVGAVALRLLRRRWWRMLVVSGRLTRSKKGGQRGKGGVDQRKRRWLCEGGARGWRLCTRTSLLEVDRGDLAVCAVEASAQVHELDVAQVSTEITIDSAAEESVCPQKWAESFGLQAVDRPLKLVNASGGRIEHFAERAVSFNLENGDGRTMEAKFEVTNVRKPLVAVARMVEQFQHPKKEKNKRKKKKTKKIKLKK